MSFSMSSHLLAVALVAAVSVRIPATSAAEGGHIQHVTIPPAITTTDSGSHIQRVPAKIETDQSESSSDIEPQPTQQTLESSDKTSTWTVEETAVSETSDGVTGETTTADYDERTTIIPELKAPADDLITANFWWGLGPVYPHLYQFKRVPHLVPIHSWNPYHDYYTYHKKYPNYP